MKIIHIEELYLHKVSNKKSQIGFLLFFFFFYPTSYMLDLNTDFNKAGI